MSLPPHIYQCVLLRLPASADAPPSYRSACLLYDQRQFDQAHAAFKQALIAQADLSKVQLPSIVEKPEEEHKERDRGQSTALTAPRRSSRPRALSDDRSSDSGDGPADDQSSPLPPSSPPQPLSAPRSNSLATRPTSPPPSLSSSRSAPRIHIDESLSGVPIGRPMSVSHTPADYSHVQPSARSLLAHLHNAVACCCVHLRLYRHAKQHLYQAIDLLPDSATLLFNLATAHLTHRHYETAVKAYRMAIKRDANNSTYHSNLGAALLAAKEYNKALAEMTKVVEMAGEGSSVAYGNLACGCIGKRKWKEAISYLRKAISVEHRTLTLLSQVSADHATQAMVTKALLHAQLAFCLLESGGDTEAVLWQASMALSLCPQLPHARRCRALVWAREERWLMAVVEAQQAVREWTDAIEGELGWEWKGWRRDRYVDELQRSIDEWKTKLPTDSGAEEEKRPGQLTAQQHQMAVDDVHTTYKQQIKALHNTVAQLQLSRTPSTSSGPQPSAYNGQDSTPPTPRTLHKQEKILCVVCMDEVRSVLFEPCKHLLCCEQCGSLVRACPFCKQPIKKRRGPIFM